jgi:hypothetical protein
MRFHVRYIKLTPALIVGALLFVPQTHAQTIVSSPAGTVQPLYSNGTVVGNGADTTEDTLMSFTIAASQLVNVGDRIHIYASGKFGATGTSDAKAPRLKVGGTTVSVPNTTGTAAGAWTIDAVVMKTGSSTQSYGALATGTAGANGTGSGTLALTDTNTIAVLVTGQDSTNANANAVTCQIFSVDYIRAF